jgi:hypothetical protein
MCLYTSDTKFQGNTLWLTVNSGTIHGLYSSNNGGASWTPAYTQFSNTNAIAVDVDNSGRIFIGTDDEGFLTAQGVFYSEDGATSFQSMNDGLLNLNVYDFAYAPSTNILYAATGSGIWQYQLTNPEPTPTPNPNAKRVYLPLVININYDEARVRYILADSQLGGVIDYYRQFPNDSSATEAVRRWDAGIRVVNIDQFERKIVDGKGWQVVYAGTDILIDGMDVKLTTDP